MSVPAVVLLHLDQRRLPAEVFDRLMARSDSRRDRERKAEEAWENFGKPGRDPDTLGGVLGTIAGEGHWVPHLKVAQLRTQWNLVVGDAIAAHSQVADFRDGVLTIRAESPGVGHAAELSDPAVDGDDPGNGWRGSISNASRSPDHGNRRADTSICGAGADNGALGAKSL